MNRVGAVLLVAAVLAACGGSFQPYPSSDGGTSPGEGTDGGTSPGHSCTGETVCDATGRCRSPRYAIDIVSGNEQQAEWFHPLAEPIVARVVDCLGAPQAGVPLTLEPPEGWLLDRTSATTDARGEVQVRARAGWLSGDNGLVFNGPEETRVVARVSRVPPPERYAYTVLGEERAAGQAGVPGLSVLGQVDEPRGLARDISTSTLYVAGDCRVLAVDDTGFSRVVAGTGVCGFSGDGGDAKAAQLDRPVGLVLWGASQLFIADSGNGRIRVVDLDTGVIDTVAGGGSAAGPDFGDEGDPKLASLSLPGWMALAPRSQELYVADTGHDRIRVVSLGEARRIRTVLAPGGSCEAEVAFQGCGGPLGCSMAWVEVDGTTRAPTLLVGGEVCGRKVGGSGAGIVRLDERLGAVYAAGAAGAAAVDNPTVTEARAMGFASPPVLAAHDRWLVVADPEGHRVYTVDAHAALFTSLMGDGVAETSGDGALARSARVNRPTGLLLDNTELFVAESGGNTVRSARALVSGTPTPLSLVYGSGSGEVQWPMEPTVEPFVVRLVRSRQGEQVPVPGLTVDWEPHESSPCHLGARTSVTDVEGAATVTARHGFYGCSARARFSNLHGEVMGLTFEKDVEQAPYGSIFTVVNEARTAGASGVPGLGVLARLPPPGAMANDHAHRLSFVAGCAVLAFRNDGFLSVVAGSISECGFSGDGGPATSARLNNPQGIAFEYAGAQDILYIADTGNHRVRRVDLATGVITTVAGGGSPGTSDGDGGQARAASLSSPHHVAVVNGVLYVSDNGHDRIRQVDLTSGLISAFVSPSSCTGKGVGLVGCAGRSCSLAADGLGVLVGGTICGSAAGGRTTGILKVYSDGAITHVAGSATGTTAEGAAGTATLISGDIFVGTDFHVYYAEPAHHRIREVSTFDGVRTVVGTGSPGYGADYGPAAGAPLHSPWGFTLSSGQLYLGDVGNGVIRYTRL